MHDIRPRGSVYVTRYGKKCALWRLLPSSPVFELERMSHERFNFVLRESRMITPRVMQLSLYREDGQPFAYVPGQFITLHMPWQDMELRRSYSVATIPGESGDVQIAATHVDGGRATGMLFGMQPGARVAATGPFGRFVLREDPSAR